MTAVPTSAAPATGPSPSAMPTIPHQRPAAPRSPLSRLRPRTTPGRLTAYLAVSLILIVTAGAIALTDSLNRGTVIDEASGQRGRMAIAAFEMYRALSDADSAAASAFLPGMSSETDLSTAYESGVSRASTAVITLADEATTPEQVDMVARLSATLPVYTGLIETARTYHRQGLPLGLAYLRNASALVRENMLPIINELQAEATSDLYDAKSQATAFPWLATLAALTALGALGYSQYHLSRRTKRVVNPGMAVATVVVIALTGWLLVSWGSASSHIDAGHRTGTEPLEALSNAHIGAQQARSNEAMTLIAQGTNTDYEAEFATIMTNLIGEDNESGLLGEMAVRYEDPQLKAFVEDAMSAAQDWQNAHVALRELDDNGEYAQAVASAVGRESGQAGEAFDRLNAALTQANELAAQKFNDETVAAGNALGLTGVGFAALTVTGMFAAAVGVQRRISEYR